MASYTPGALAQNLQTETNKRSKKATALFSQDFSLKRKKKIKKKATKKVRTTETSDPEAETESSVEKQQDLMEDEESGSEEEEDEVKESSRPKKKKRDVERDNRTIFVGNIARDVEKKDVVKLFKNCGGIDTVRLRSVTPSNPKLPKRAALITKDFHDSMSTLNAYIVFKEQDAANFALKLNGVKLFKNHLRVDSIHPGAKKVHDDKRSVFLGNLPLELKEEEVRLHFTECGEVENVRLVRDRGTGIGKGFGFVLFKDVCAVDLALKLNGEMFKKRSLRVMPSGDKRQDKKASEGNFKERYEKDVEKRKKGKEGKGKEGKEGKERKKKTEGQKVSYRERKQRNKKKSKLKQKNVQKKKMASILTGKKKD